MRTQLRHYRPWLISLLLLAAAAAQANEAATTPHANEAAAKPHAKPAEPEQLVPSIQPLKPADHSASVNNKSLVVGSRPVRKPAAKRPAARHKPAATAMHDSHD